MHNQLLICDDETDKREDLKTLLTSLGFDVECAKSAKQFCELLEKNTYQAAFLDLIMPDCDSLSLLLKLNKETSPPIIATAPLRAEELLGSALNAGAKDLITYPLNARRVKLILETHLKKQRLKEENSALKEKTLHWQLAFPQKNLSQTIKALEKYALTPLPLLIEAPQGTLQTEVINKIIALSERADKPHFKLKCNAVKREEISQNEFILHFSNTKNGYIILENVDYLTLEEQQALLSALPKILEKQNKYNPRLIVTTKTSLFEKVKLGQFNEMLFYQLSLQRLVLPTLIDRLVDFPFIIKEMLHSILLNEVKIIEGISQKALEMLSQAYWLSNDKELMLALKKAIIQTENSILGEEDFNFKTKIKMKTKETMAFNLTSSLENNANLKIMSNGALKTFTQIEDEIYKAAFYATEGNISLMARQLGIGRSTLYRKLTIIGLIQNEKSANAA